MRVIENDAAEDRFRSKAHPSRVVVEDNTLIDIYVDGKHTVVFKREVNAKKSWR